MAYAVTAVGRIIRAAGGSSRVVAKLGPPVTQWSLITWGRMRSIPEQYHEVLSDMSGIPIEEFSIPRAGRDRVYPTSLAYRLMCEGLRLKVRKAAQIHRVSMDQVQRWMTGAEEVPLQSFVDLYYYASSRPVPSVSMTVDEAMKLTGLSQRKICETLGLNRSAASRWRAAGNIPPRYAEALMDMVRGMKRRKELTIE